ncbi:coiled-coil domain-containing protein 86-like [Ptychodera flava]|uniref:coiled-coil domain-containing protein 86-like n=1 Tax=Ptychodera flava TaxID=63121 RepID=UPI00396AA68D
MTKAENSVTGQGRDLENDGCEKADFENNVTCDDLAKRLQPSETISKEQDGAVVEPSNVWQSYKQVSHSQGVPKGRPKSGRKWKTEQTKRFSDMKQDKPFRTSWQKKMRDRAEKKAVKKYEQELKEQRQKKEEIKRKKRAEKKRKKFENERKAEIVQVIKNPAKIKRMKKKQLRSIEKRDTSKMLQGKS